MNQIASPLLTDFYKVGHVFQYPKDTTMVYANWTPRGSKLPGVTHMAWFGLQYLAFEYLQDHFDLNFFGRPWRDVEREYQAVMESCLGAKIPIQHMKDLHMLGYLPIQIKALPEGTLVPMRVPCMTIRNTLPQFFWLTNALETLISTVLWQPSTSATIAHRFRKLFDHWAKVTGMPPEFVQWQGHDFSMRGMSSPESGLTSGMGHLLSFTGTDTIPAIMGLEEYYKGEGLVGGSVPATEHSVMCAGGQDGEFETFKNLITNVYPKGIVSIVSDTWDLWAVLTDFLPRLKNEIMARDGKVVIRPDSGDPADILCGDPNARGKAGKGVLKLLWNTFGGTQTSTGHRLLDPHIGAIYGDGISYDRASDILSRLATNGFASQVVFGLGSYTYQHNTRDTLGLAMKATYTERNGQGYAMQKDPVTDDGTKKSAKGLLRVVRNKSTNELELEDNQTWMGEDTGELELVFRNGILIREQTLTGIRSLLAAAR